MVRGEIFKSMKIVDIDQIDHIRKILIDRGIFLSWFEAQINGKYHLLHRLIAVAFDLPKEDDQDTVDHIDNDPSNNRKENLKWANQSEQIERSHATNEERGSSAPKQSKPVEGRELGTEA